MNLKTKSFKKSIFFADMRQLWVILLVYGGIIFFGTFFDFYLDRTPYGNAIPYNFVNSRFFASNCLSNFCGLVAGAVLALRLFSYLYSPSAISFYHGLPFKRKSLFLTKTVSGITLLIVPVLANFAIVALSKLCGSTIQIRWLSLLYWLGNQTIYSLLAFSCVIFAVMISGNILSLLGTCILLCIAPLAIIGFIHMVCQNYLLGYAYDPTNFFNFIYITPDILLFKLRGLIYVFAIPALLIISYFMYKKRDLERVGEAIVFPKLKVAFIYFAGLLGGIFSYFYFSIWNFKTLLFMLPFGIVAIIIANMINRRGVTLKGALFHTAIYTASVLLLLGAFRSDIIGFQKRVPSLDKIESVTVAPDYYYRYRIDDNAEKYLITSKEDIEKVTAYHTYKTETGTLSSMPNYFEISYKLKNGRTLKRGYQSNFVNEKEYLESVVNLEQVKMLLYPIYKAENLQLVNMDLHNALDTVMIYPNNPVSDKLIDALNEDIKNLEYDENSVLSWNSSNFNTPLYIDIQFKNVNSEKPYDDSFYFPISFGFTKTIELLKEYGYYDRFMTAKHIASVGIDRADDDKGDLAIGDYRVDEIITEPEKIRETLDMIFNSYKNPVWYEDGAEDAYDEYIFLDVFGDTHTFGLLRK
ncbi:MAG: hypothetical protein IK057_02750 [Clostridia bacterium]|nr:hypothetical protein [Clostridia bacterium]